MTVSLQRLGASLMRPARATLSVWRRSIQARVVISTMLLSAIVIGLVGWALLRQVADGLVDGRRAVAVAEAQAGFDNAQEQLDVSVVSDANSQSQVLTQLVDDITSRSGSPRSYEVMLQGPVDIDGTAGSQSGVRSSAPIRPDSIPTGLARQVSGSDGTYWT
ncbi:MAG: hypothetical protein ACRDO8_13745, partial [Nocardioidaceae bacterium]